MAKKSAKPKKNLGLSVLAEIKADKAKKPKRAKGGGGGDGRADADTVKRIVDNSFAFLSRDGDELVVDITTTYPMRGKKPKCRCGFAELPDLAAAILVVHAKHEADLRAKAEEFKARMEAEGK
jgi:hypothetical protein